MQSENAESTSAHGAGNVHAAVSVHADINRSLTIFCNEIIESFLQTGRRERRPPINRLNTWQTVVIGQAPSLLPRPSQKVPERRGADQCAAHDSAQLSPQALRGRAATPGTLDQRLFGKSARKISCEGFSCQEAFTAVHE